jgi:hypothetical protein
MFARSILILQYPLAMRQSSYLNEKLRNLSVISHKHYLSIYIVVECTSIVTSMSHVIKTGPDFGPRLLP